MKAEALLELYERVAEAPDAIARLRRFVLDLAVRGKLVEQDAGDEPASRLLMRITAEHARLVELGLIKEPKSTQRVERSVLPFHAPEHWSWCRLVDVARVAYGFAFESARFNGERRGMPLIRIRDISRSDTEACYDGDFDPSYLVHHGDYLVGMDGDFNLRRWSGGDALLNQRVLRIDEWRCGVSPEFVRIPLQMVLDHIHGSTSQTTVKHLSAKQVNGIEIPLAPLAEQHRIVAKVDELMALLDHLDAARSAREATRNRLTTATLTRLTAVDSDPESLRSHACFALDALPALTDRAKHIPQLRQTILDLAVKGQLVEQRNEDGSARLELAAISVQKEALRAEGKFKLFEGNLDRSKSAQPFPIPEGWVWCFLDDIAAVGRGGSPRPIQAFLTKDEDGIPWIKIGDATRGSIFIDATEERIKPSGLTKSRLVVPGDLLLSNSMSFGFPYITRVTGCIHDGWLVIRTPETLVSKLYLQKLFLSKYASDAFSESAAGAVVQNLNADKVRQLAVPLPPLAEQLRIVARVDELLKLCSCLEAALQAVDTKRAILLEALLRDALDSGSAERKAA
jgi:type I restriction enzyme S subunit